MRYEVPLRGVQLRKRRSLGEGDEESLGLLDVERWGAGHESDEA